MTADLSQETLSINNPLVRRDSKPLELENTQPREIDPSKPRYLTKDEILAATVKDFGIDQHSGYQGSIEKASLEQFIAEKVTGVRINGVDVLSVDFEHSDEEPDPYIGRLIGTDRTKLAVLEYFYPELQQNLARSPLPNAERIANNVDSGLRMEYARKIAKIAELAGKPVAVTDIANKPSYAVIDQLFRSLPLMSLAPAAVPGLEGFIASGALGGLWLAAYLHQGAREKGIFNKDQISRLDKFMLDFEQARRMYLARGVEQLTEEYPPTQEIPNPQIVVVYPKAHGIRMADALVNPQGSLESAKDIVYKTFGAPLDFAVRTYAWKDSLSRLRSSGYKWGQFSPVEDEALPLDQKLEGSEHRWGQFAPVEDEGLSSDSINEVQGESTPGWRLVSKRGI